MWKPLLFLGLAAVCECFVANSPSRGLVKESTHCVTDGKCPGIFPRIGKKGPTLSLSENSESRFDRRKLIAGMLLLTVPHKNSLASPQSTSSPIVVEGAMRLEQGSEKVLQQVGGRANATIYLRIVGRGIISKTYQTLDISEFPPPGQPKPGDTNGVPFVITEADLNEKTEKGVTVNRALWVDDDIFVRIDVDGVQDGQVR